MLLKFLVYILVGIPINWLSVIFTWGLLGVITSRDIETFRELNRKYDAKKVGFKISNWPLIFRILVSMIAWPISVLNNLYCGGGAVKEAIRRKKK